MRPAKGEHGNALLSGFFVVRNLQGFVADSSQSYAEMFMCVG